MKNHIFFALFILGNFICTGQKNITLEESILEARTRLAPENLGGLQWVKGSNLYSYNKKESNENYLQISDVKKNIQKSISLSTLNTVLQAASIEKMVSIPSITWMNENEFIFEHQQKILKFNVANNSILCLNNIDENAENGDYEPQLNSYAYTLENNLYLSNNKKEKIAVTNFTDKNMVAGKSIHREEFGIVKGTFWSPSGNNLAFYQMDQTDVTDYMLLDYHTIPATAHAIKYPMAGQKSHYASVGIFNTKTNETIYLKTTGAKDHYLTNIVWSPDEKLIYLAELNRDQNLMQLNTYNAANGEFVKTLFEEKNSSYVHPEKPAIFFKELPNQFIWNSERDGFNHLYLYNINGQLIKQLTKGNFVVKEILGLDASGENIIYSATDRPVDTKIYSLNIKSGKAVCITPTNASHDGMLSSDGNFLIDNFSNLDTPRKINILSTKGKPVAELLVAPNPLKEYKIGKTEIFTIKSVDSTVLFCRLIKPFDFDSKKKYPVLVYVYNGPGVQLITDSWLGSASLWMHYMAAQGYLIFTVDGRGSSNGGLEFEQATFRNLGTTEIKDQLEGVKYLKKLHFVDGERLAVHGWSFGGFMTTSLMLREPGVFNTGVAGGSVTDWSMYEIMYTERYMDTPETNPEGYAKSDLKKYVKNLKGKLLMIHDTDDDVVVMQHAMTFLDAAIKNGKQLNYFTYPGHKHNVAGKDRVHLMTKVLNYIIDNNVKTDEN